MQHSLCQNKVRETDMAVNELKLADKYLQNVVNFEDDLEYGSIRSLGDARQIIQNTIRILMSKGE